MPNEGASPKQYPILKVLVGSRAHHLNNEDSDYDWRGVFVTPTTDILKIGSHPDQTNWIEGKEDNTSFEVGKFLFMATKCNPTILEMFKAYSMGASGLGGDRVPYPKHVTMGLQYGEELQSLFPHIWQPKPVMDAFIGYGINQRKKFLEDKDTRPAKYACAYLRTLYIAHELLTTGLFTLDVSHSEIFDVLRAWRAGSYSKGEVIDLAIKWEAKVRKAYEENPTNPDYSMEKVNDFLLKIRKEYWE